MRMIYAGKISIGVYRRIINVREFMIRLETNLFSNPTRLLLDRTLKKSY